MKNLGQSLVMKNFSIVYLFVYLLPKNLLSNLAGRLANFKRPKYLIKIINRLFVKLNKINMEEAEFPLGYYRSLQELFTRKLKPELRPISNQKNIIISPCDGKLYQAAGINGDLILKVKNKKYLIADLIQDKNLAARFYEGHYCIIYLAPKDYHRFHMPINGNITETIYIPGQLWPVNNWALNNIENLFCVNERIISLIEFYNEKSSKNSLILYIAVGATLVGNIRLNFCNINTKKLSNITRLRHEKSINLQKGEEFGQFMFGSTIVLLFEKELINNFAKKSQMPIKYGEPLAFLNH